jgi:acyl carrier protein
MNEQDTLSAVRSCIKDALKLTDADASSVDRNTTPVQFSAWTSMAHLDLMLGLEKRFDIMFDADEIASLASVASILDAIKRHRTV